MVVEWAGSSGKKPTVANTGDWAMARSWKTRGHQSPTLQQQKKNQALT